MIVCERVTRTFETAPGDFTVVRDVSFTVAPGRFVSIVLEKMEADTRAIEKHMLAMVREMTGG